MGYHYDERMSMYVNYRQKGKTRKEYTQDYANIDIEAVEKASPNFKTFFQQFKDHPALGPGAVEESVVAPGSIVGPDPSGLLQNGTGSRCGHT